MSERATLTPPEVAARLRVSADKVLGWIAAGELPAVNVAARPGGRPRWRIDAAALRAFEARRSSQPAAPVPEPRRKRQAAEVIQFF
jgi:excisionase family DNA binding protein